MHKNATESTFKGQQSNSIVVFSGSEFNFFEGTFEISGKEMVVPSKIKNLSNVKYGTNISVLFPMFVTVNNRAIAFSFQRLTMSVTTHHLSTHHFLCHWRTSSIVEVSQI